MPIDSLDGGRERHCDLCRRFGPSTRHHLTPRSLGGVGICILCPDCHCFVHRVFDNALLAEHYNRLRKIRRHPRVRVYLGQIGLSPFSAAGLVK